VPSAPSSRPCTPTATSNPILLFLAIVLIPFITGCAGTKPVLIAGVPDDLSVDLAVLPAKGVTSESIGNLRLPGRRAHYVLHPDGALHVSRGNAATGDNYPALTCRLSTDDMLAVWQFVQRIRLEPSIPSSTTTATKATDRTTLPKDGITYILWIRARGQERMGRIDTANARLDEKNLREITGLINELDRLCWGR